MGHWPQAPCVHHVNVQGSQCHHNWAIRDGITTYVAMAKQNMILLAEVASHGKPEAPASACLRGP